MTKQHFKLCPYCGSTNIEEKEDEWYMGIKGACNNKNCGEIWYSGRVG